MTPSTDICAPPPAWLASVRRRLSAEPGWPGVNVATYGLASDWLPLLERGDMPDPDIHSRPSDGALLMKFNRDGRSITFIFKHGSPVRMVGADRDGVLAARAAVARLMDDRPPPWGDGGEECGK